MNGLGTFKNSAMASLKYGLGLVDFNSSIELLLGLNWAGFNKNWKNGVWLKNALNDLTI